MITGTLMLSKYKVVDSRSFETCTVRKRQSKQKRFNTIEIKCSDLLRICRNEILMEEVEELISNYTRQSNV